MLSVRHKLYPQACYANKHAPNLSLGDRACLSLAMELQAVVLTGDKAWKGLDLPIEIVDIREG